MLFLFNLFKRNFVFCKSPNFKVFCFIHLVCLCTWCNLFFFLFVLLSNRKMKCIWTWSWTTFLRLSTEWQDTTAEPNRPCPWFLSRYQSVCLCVSVTIMTKTNMFHYLLTRRGRYFIDISHCILILASVMSQFIFLIQSTLFNQYLVSPLLLLQFNKLYL